VVFDEAITVKSSELARRIVRRCGVGSERVLPAAVSVDGLRCERNRAICAGDLNILI
jgi:hypothetical protein